MYREIADYSNWEIGALSQFLRVRLLEGDDPRVLHSLLPKIHNLMGSLDFVLIQDVLRNTGSELRLVAQPVGPVQSQYAETVRALLPETGDQSHPFGLLIVLGGESGLEKLLRMLTISPELNLKNLRNTGLLTIVAGPTQ